MKVIFTTLYALVVLPFASVATFAQVSPECPKLEIVGPSELTMPGGLAVFSLKPVVKNEDKLEIKWEVSLGTIEEGQGTTKIAVRADTDKLISSITATVKVIGLPEGCTNTTSETVGVAAIIDIFPIDEYGRMSYNDERARIDVALAQVKEHPNFDLVFVLRAPERASKASIAARKNRIERHVAGYRKFPRSRIRFIRHDSSDVSTAIYMLPPELIKDFFGGDTVLP